MSGPSGERRVPPSAPLLVAGAVYVAASGYVHLREWLDLYRHVPSNIPGSAVVRVGFPITAAVSGGLAVALLAGARRGGRSLGYVVAGALAFEAGSAVALVLSRTGSLFGWSEATWTGGASQALLTEVAAVALLSFAAAIAPASRWRRRAPVAAGTGPPHSAVSGSPRKA